jgi:hypothetical protein
MTTRAQIDAGGAEFSLSLKDDLTKQVQASLQTVVTEVRAVKAAVDSEIKDIGRQIESTAKSVAALSAGVTALGGASLFGFGKAIVAAGNFAETVNMFEAVFKDQSAAVRAWGKEYGKTVGRAEAQMLDFLAQSQDTFVPLGFDRREAAELSKTVTKLAIDLGSFKNIDDGESLRRLLGGLVGNTENLKAFGVQATAAAVKAKALSLGFDPNNLTSYEKALAILEITIDGTQDAQGDAINTAKEFANSVKGLQAQIKRLTINLGSELKGAATAAVRALSSMLSLTSDLLERFPVLTKVAAALAIAITAIGLAATAAATAIAFLGASLGTIGILALGSLVRTAGVMGTLAIASGIARTAVTGVSTAFGAFAVSSRAAVTTSATFAGAMRGVAAAIGRVGAGLAAVFQRGVMRAALLGLVAGFKTAIATVTAAFAAMFRFVIAASLRMAVALVNPWTLLATAIVAAMKLVERYYRQQEEFEKKRAKNLEQERQRIVAESFRAAGQPVPDDLSNNRDYNKARVVGTKDTALSQFDSDLAKEIAGMRTALESFRERVAGAERLLSRGSINQEQFDKFAKQELESFRKSDPVTQARESLRESLLTPIEVFEKAVAEAKTLFSDEPAMFDRARQAAIEQFKANDKATQLAQQLRTPLEKFEAAAEEANRLFADSPENLKRALDDAAEQFRASDPAEQLKMQLRTPAEILRDRMIELGEILASAPAEMREQLATRGRQQAFDEFNRTDPDRRGAKEIRDSLKSDGVKIAEKIAKASELVSKGLLSQRELAKFRGNLIKEAVGDRPEVDLSRSVASTSATFASQVGAFGPAFNADQELVKFNEKQLEVQQEMNGHLAKMANRRRVLNK